MQDGASSGVVPHLLDVGSNRLGEPVGLEFRRDCELRVAGPQGLDGQRPAEVQTVSQSPGESSPPAEIMVQT